MKLMEIIGDKKTNGWIMLRMMCCVLLFHMRDIVKLWKKSLDLEGKIV